MSEESQAIPSNAEPTATPSTAPMWIFVVMLALSFLGFVFFDHHSGWFDGKVYAPYATAEQLEAYQPKSGAAAAQAQGKKVYESVCGTCHAPDGMGKPGTAPPLAGSEWVIAKGFERLAKSPLEGLNGPIQVEGKEWNLNMAPMGSQLSDTDLAAVLTYMRSSWGNKADEVTADDIKSIRAAIGNHAQPIQGAQLKAMPE